MDSYEEKHGYRTGSTVFGVATEKSDIDIVIHPFQESLVNISEYTQTSEEYDDSELVTYRHKNKNINLLVCRTEEHYNAWVNATEIFKVLCLCKIFKNSIRIKKYRIELFANLRNNKVIGELNK